MNVSTTSNNGSLDSSNIFSNGIDFDKSNTVDQWETDIQDKIAGSNDIDKYHLLDLLSFIADENGDGKATKEEIDDVFNTVDINQDGKLSAEEIKFVNVFANKDGKRGLSDDEKEYLDTYIQDKKITSTTEIDSDDIRDAQDYLKQLSQTSQTV